MKAKILKRLTVNGEVIEQGTIVDVSTWRNARSLEGSRYIALVSEEDTKKETKSKVIKDLVEE